MEKRKRMRLMEEIEEKRKAVRAKRNKGKRDIALAETVSFLRNAAIGDTLPPVEQVLTELVSFGNILSPAFFAMLSHIRQNDPAGALSAFTEIAGEKEGGDIGRLLLQWDRLDGGELTETLLSYQRHLSEVRYTLDRNADELASDLLYIPVVLNVMLVFVNFILVGYFLNEEEMFRMIF